MSGTRRFPRACGSVWLRGVVGLSCWWVIACGGADGGDTATSEGGAAPGGRTVSFRDPSSGFSTDLVYDATRETMTFEQGTNALIWRDGTRIDGFRVNDPFLTADEFFMVRFGTELGARRAFFTETDTGTICDVVLTHPDRIAIYRTQQLPPGE